MREQSSQRRLTPLLVVLGVVAVGAIVAFAQSGKKTIATGVEAASRKESPQVAVTPVSAAARKPLTYYTGGVRTDLFSAPQPPAPALKAVAAKPLPPPAPAVVDPFAEYAYTGTVQVGGQTLALVENTKTKEGQYLRPGDPFIGGSVDQVTERTLTIKVGTKTQTMAKTDNFSLTPLDKNAPYLSAPTPQPGQPQPGGVPGQPGAGPTFPGMDRLPPGVQDRIRQRWQNMTPEQQQQARDRMLNRRFDRGGGGGGGRGGRGGGGGFGGFGGGFGG